MNDENTETEGGLGQRIKESPRTVSALIIILIVAAAIYAFSGDQDQTTPSPAPAGEIESPVIDDTTATEGSAAPETAMKDEVPKASPVQAVTQQQLAQVAASLPQPRKTDSGYVEVAAAGEGVTHLARKATTRYLAENQTTYTITNEHRIFIEDYIKDRLGSKGLRLGEEQTISFELMKEAVAAAEQLNEQQLRNLSQYTYALT